MRLSVGDGGRGPVSWRQFKKKQTRKTARNGPHGIKNLIKIHNPRERKNEAEPCPRKSGKIPKATQRVKTQKKKSSCPPRFVCAGSLRLKRLICTTHDPHGAEEGKGRGEEMRSAQNRRSRFFLLQLVERSSVSSWRRG